MFELSQPNVINLKKKLDNSQCTQQYNQEDVEFVMMCPIFWHYIIYFYISLTMYEYTTLRENNNLAIIEINVNITTLLTSADKK